MILNQIEKKQAIFNKVFRPEHILKARMIYEGFTDKCLMDLQEALREKDEHRIVAIKKQLTLLNKNLMELKDFETPVFSFRDIMSLTVPVRAIDVRKKMEMHRNVFSQKNVKNALTLYQNSIDKGLDELQDAISKNDNNRIEELKVQLDKLRKNIFNLYQQGVVK